MIVAHQAAKDLLAQIRDHDRTPVHARERRTSWHLGHPYFWVIRNDRYTLLPGVSPYDWQEMSLSGP